MIAGKKDLILRELELGTGAAIGVSADRSGLRSGMRIWFGDLDDKHGPVAELRPYGLRGHVVTLSFGNFSGEVIEQIRKASPEDIQLARALVASIRTDIEIDVGAQNLAEWVVTHGSFRITAKVRDIERPLEDAAVVATCREVIVPIMAAMAELIGYDILDENPEYDEPAFEGALLPSLVLKRERNPRNRLLAIRVHGEKCFACGLEPLQLYGEAGSIIEVHHLEPVSLLSEPRPYDPRTDLVPLCPNCHRAVHTRRPLPFSIHEIQGLMGRQND